MTSLLKSAVIMEGISHIEDLPLQDFMRAVETLKDKVVTEKLDGSNLWFGIDETGFYTSREGKSKKGNRFYKVEDYPLIASYNGFRAAHLALAKHTEVINKHLANGDVVEIEVLFGRQPNTVTYGNEEKNFIVIIRGIETDKSKVDSLAKALTGKPTTVTSKVITSEDGTQLKAEDKELTWEFTQVKPVDTHTVDISSAKAKLEELKKYLSEPNSKVNGKTNGEVAEISLTSIDKDKRPAVKAAREEQLQYILDNFKNPIKEILLNTFVRKVKPFLQSHDLDPSEDIGVEGVVATDPKSGDMIKIVDKDVFTAINKFNNSIRNMASGVVKTDDQDAPLELRGGAFGQAKIRIGELFGLKELALSSGTKKILTKFKGATPEETAVNLANSIKLTSFGSAREKVSAILTNCLKEIDDILEEFKSNAQTFKLTLKTGKEIGISPEVMKRNLTALAETKRDINQINKAVLKSRELPEMIMALYGRTIQGLFSGDSEVKESKFNLIKTFEDGEGGDAPAPAEPQMATVAGSIAPVEKKLMNGRMITRRPRKFIKKKKFAQQTYEAADISKRAATMKKAFKAKIKKTGEIVYVVGIDNKSQLSTGLIFTQTEKSLGSNRTREFMPSELEIVQESLLRMFEFDQQFAKSVDDSAAAQTDVEFKMIRNNIQMSGDSATQGDINNYLNKAHELNDEVDTVTFGMELDDGSVVKVYVNQAQADAFEKALADMLGQEDDVEKVIDELANAYDIVDVEWPDGMQSDSETPVATDAIDMGNGEDGTIDSIVDPNGDDQVSPVIDLGGDDNIDGEDEEPEGDDTSLLQQIDGDVNSQEQETDGEETSGEEEPSADQTDDTTAADSSDEQPADGEPVAAAEPEAVDLSTTDDESDNAEPTDQSPEEADDASADTDEVENGDDKGDEVPPKKKKKKSSDEESNDDQDEEEESTKKEESAMSFGQRFKEKILVEKAKQPVKANKEEKAVEESHDFPEAVKKLMKEFPTRGSKMMIGLMFVLGAPLDAMVMKKAELKKSVEEAGDMFMKDGQFRNWIKRAIDGINEAGGTSGPVKESLDKELANSFQKLVFGILTKIGLTDSIEKLARSTLRTNIKKIAAIAQTDTNVRAALKMIGEMLGVDAVTGNEVTEAHQNPKSLSRREALKQDKSFYADEEDGYWYVFGDNSGFAYSSHGTKEEATVAAKAMKSKVNEAKNHLGNNEYNTWAGWRAAAKKAAADADLGAVWFEGDKDIAQAMVGAKPFATGKTFSIGEWDGEKGDVNKANELADTKKRMSKVTEAAGDLDAALKALKAAIAKGGEFPDEAYKIAKKFNVKQSALEKAYDGLNEEVESGPDAWVNMVKSVATKLGIPSANLAYRQSATDLAIKQARTKIGNYALIQRKLEAVMSMISESVEESYQTITEAAAIKKSPEWKADLKVLNKILADWNYVIGGHKWIPESKAAAQKAVDREEAEYDMKDSNAPEDYAYDEFDGVAHGLDDAEPVQLKDGSIGFKIGIDWGSAEKPSCVKFLKKLLKARGLDNKFKVVRSTEYEVIISKV